MAGRESWLVILAASLGLMLTQGCTDVDPGAGETPGELGKGVFRYTCSGSDDAACDESGVAAVFPRFVATTSSFDVEYDPYDTKSAGPGIVVTPASEKYVSDSGDHLRANQPGNVALLARQTSDSRLIDFVHIDIRDLSSLEIDDAAGGAVELTLKQGSALSLLAVPLDEQHEVLAGALDYGWSSSDSSVLRLDLSSTGREMRLTALSSGSAALKLESGAISHTLTFTVEP